jgi:hypothetical protein
MTRDDRLADQFIQSGGIATKPEETEIVSQVVGNLARDYTPSASRLTAWTLHGSAKNNSDLATEPQPPAIWYAVTRDENAVMALPLASREMANRVVQKPMACVPNV